MVARVATIAGITLIGVVAHQTMCRLAMKTLSGHLRKLNWRTSTMYLTYVKTPQTKVYANPDVGAYYYHAAVADYISHYRSTGMEVLKVAFQDEMDRIMGMED
jgi:hypothetical protein